MIEASGEKFPLCSTGRWLAIAAVLGLLSLVAAESIWGRSSATVELFPEQIRCTLSENDHPEADTVLLYRPRTPGNSFQLSAGTPRWRLLLSRYVAALPPELNIPPVATLLRSHRPLIPPKALYFGGILKATLPVRAGPDFQG